MFYKQEECNAYEWAVMLLADRLGRLMGITDINVIDSYGIGGVLLCPDKTLVKVAADMRRRIEVIAPRMDFGTNWKSQKYRRVKDHWPTTPCCYAFYCNSVLTYIGSTWNLRERMRTHDVRKSSNVFATPWGDFKRVVVKFRPMKKYGDWAMIELRLIRRLQPRGNTRGVNRNV